MNKALLIGFTGDDPVVSILEGGNIRVANFSLATSKKWTDKSGQKQESTEWHRVVCWRRLAEVVSEYVKKGQQLFVEGEIKTRMYEDKDGTKRYITEIYAGNIEMLGRKTDVADKRASQQAEAFRDMPPNNDGADDLPF